MKIIDYELVYDLDYLFEKKVFIYGTGIYGNKVAAAFLQMEKEISGFCETNPKKNEFSGKKVIPIEILIKNYDEDDVLVIISSEKYFKEMIDALQAVEHMAVCTYYAFFISLYLNDKTEKMTGGLKRKIKLFKKISLEMSIQGFLNSWWTTKNYSDILANPSLIWLYQPGKVASSTIRESTSLETHHMHSLAFGFNADNGLSGVYSQMLDEIKKRPIKIITGIREPISRDISAFFHGSDRDIWPLITYGHNFWLYLFGDYSRCEKLNVQALRKRACTFEKSLNDSFEHLSKSIIEYKSDEFLWFDYEIKALFGVDIYDYPFDREKGYTVIEQDNIQILVYKCEKLNQLEKVIGEFIEDPEFSLVNANQGEEKVYSYVYKKFKEEVKLNRQYFDYYYADNPRLKHFYTDSEIEQFRNKWGKKL